MSHINVTINGRQYRMACEEGQEVRLLKLAESLETRVGELRVMAALTVCDELLDANARIRALEGELETLRNVRVAATDRAKSTQVAVANALNAAAERIEKTTQMLNRTIGKDAPIPVDHIYSYVLANLGPNGIEADGPMLAQKDRWPANFNYIANMGAYAKGKTTIDDVTETRDWDNPAFILNIAAMAGVSTWF